MRRRRFSTGSRGDGLIVIKLERNVGKKRALAVGDPARQRPIFAFSDTDSVWAPDALSGRACPRASPEVGAVYRPLPRPERHENLLTKIQDAWYEGNSRSAKLSRRVRRRQLRLGAARGIPQEAIFNYIPAWMATASSRQEFRFATDRTLTAFVLGRRHKAAKLTGRTRLAVSLEVDYG